jgi:hypothetical protein
MMDESLQPMPRSPAQIDEFAPTFELTQGLLDNLAEVAPFARVDDHDIHICHMAFDLQTEHRSPFVHPDPTDQAL